jgi:alkanesulfonate monooxygenase SsuD/methylene tetrahydromethanopterin reductase-like flavin-dependent oxidoreductase (luciferase family)
MLRLDICTLVDHLPDPHTHRHNETQREKYATLMAMAEHGEQGGFGGFWVGEHHASYYIAPSPQMILAAAAMRTKTIQLGTAISLLPNSDPVRLAEEFATLDLLSNGRAELGLGSGITQHTYKLFGQKLEDADGLSRENLDLLETLWTQEEVNWTGKYRTPIEDTRLEPRTLSGKAIPITRATSGSERTVRDAAQRGHKLALHTVLGTFSDSRAAADLYRQAYRESGNDPAGMKVVATVYAYLAPDGAKARTYFEPYRLNYFVYSGALVNAKGRNQNLVARREAIGGQHTDTRQAEMIGSPSEVIEMIEKAYEDLNGFDELKILFDVGGLPREQTLRSIDLFAEKVLPHVAGLGGSSHRSQPNPAGIAERADVDRHPR